MTVIFSKKCEYGLQAVLYLSTLDGYDNIASADEISRKLNIPREFVSKILQSLVLKKIVKSRKGNSGGFYLGRPASEIKLIEIVEAIDGLTLFNSCVLGFPNCSPENPCPVHKKWGKLRKEALDMLTKETLEKFKKKSVAKIKTLSRYID